MVSRNLSFTIICAPDREMGPTASRTTTSQIPCSISRHAIRLAVALVSFAPQERLFDTIRSRQSGTD